MKKFKIGDKVKVGEDDNMFKFKVGDRVEIVNKNIYLGHSNYFGEVVEIRPNDIDKFRVKSQFNYGESILGYKEIDLKLVKSVDEEEIGDFDNFTKDKLSTGMVVELGDGSKWRVLLNTMSGDLLIDINNRIWCYLNDFNNDLTSKRYPRDSEHIVRVYGTDRNISLVHSEVSDYNLLWVRPEIKSPFPKKYHLKDKFFGEYLNLNRFDNTFFLAFSVETDEYKTEFTDVEIEELEIPIERFDKIEVK